MAIRVFKSTDSGAPSLNSLIASSTLLDVLTACLVTGYGSTAPLGWSLAFSATGKAVYRAPTGVRNYLRVTDTAGTNASATGYASMTDIDNGDGMFPSLAHAPSGGQWTKSVTSNSATVRPWVVIADDVFFYLFTAPNNTDWDGYCFGDLANSYGATVSMLIGGAAGGDRFETLSFFDVNTDSHFLSMPVSGLRQSTVGGKISGYAAASMGSVGMAYPSPVDGKLYLAPVRVVDSLSASFGPNEVATMPGLYNPIHARPIADQATYSNADILGGRTLHSQYITTNSSCMIDITGPWR